MQKYSCENCKRAQFSVFKYHILNSAGYFYIKNFLRWFLSIALRMTTAHDFLRHQRAHSPNQEVSLDVKLAK